MAYSKKPPSSSKAVHTAELTTGQLVLAVSTFLIVLLGVFLLGIIVGEYQYKMREARANMDTEVVRTVDMPGEGTQPGGFKEVKRDSAGSDSAGSAAQEPFRSPTESAATSVVVPAPSPGNGGSATPAPETTLPAPTKADEPKLALPAVATPSKSQPVPLEPIDAEDVTPEVDADSVNAEEAKEVAPIELLDDEPAPISPAPSAAPGQKVFSVQIAALSEPKNADALKKRIEATTPWPVDIQPNANKKLHIVFVGRFATQSEAEQARDELREKPEFGKAFISSRIVE